MRILLNLLFFSIILIGCECPPNLNTDKDIIPRESSYLSIINLLDNPNTISVNSLNIQIKKITKIPNVHFQNFINFPSGIVDFKLLDGNKSLLNTIIQTEKDEYYTILLYQNNAEVEHFLIREQIDKVKNNLYLRFVNFSKISKIRFVIKSNLPQNLEYNLINKGITELVAFPSTPFTLELYKLPSDSLITKIENINLNLGNIGYFILIGDANNLDLFQVINKYRTN